MQDRSLQQLVLMPVDNAGQRIPILAASHRSNALTPGQTYHIWATKVCWVLIGDNTVVAIEAAVAGTDPLVMTGGSFPLSAGAVYEFTPDGTNDQYLAVIEDSNYVQDTGYVFIGQATGRPIP